MRRQIGAVLALVLPLTCSAAPCAKSYTTAELVSSMDEAEAHFAAIELEKFMRATDLVRGMLPCVTDEVPVAVAARLHRFQGLRAFVDKDEEAAALSFAASRALEPEYYFPETLVQTGNPVALTYRAFDVSTGMYDTIAAPRSGRILFDGTASDQRPATWPTVTQVINKDGAVQHTAYLLPDHPLPDYDLAAPTGPGGPMVPLLGGAAASAITGVLLYSLALGAKGEYTDPTTDVGELDGLKGKANTLGGAAIGLGVLTIGLGGAGFALGGAR